MEQFFEFLQYLRGWNTPSILVRLTTAMLCGGLIGMESLSDYRSRNGRVCPDGDPGKAHRLGNSRQSVRPAAEERAAYHRH